MRECATHSGIKRTGQKKWPLRGAAKFREETPRKGGGFAIKDRNTALQQYAEKTGFVQVKKQTLRKFFPRKTRKYVKNVAQLFIIVVPFAPWCTAIKPQFPTGDSGIHTSVAAPKQKIRAKHLRSRSSGEA
jgi:hypothetical protein